MVLRYTDTSKSVTTANTWQTAIDLSTIARFNRFYERDAPIKLFDGNNRIEELPAGAVRSAAWRTKDAEHLLSTTRRTRRSTSTAPSISPARSTSTTSRTARTSPTMTAHRGVFPSWSHPLLGFYAVAINKGGVDYDDINARMAPDNRAQANAHPSSARSWDKREAAAGAAEHRPVPPRRRVWTTEDAIGRMITRLMSNSRDLHRPQFRRPQHLRQGH